MTVSEGTSRGKITKDQRYAEEVRIVNSVDLKSKPGYIAAVELRDSHGLLDIVKELFDREVDTVDGTHSNEPNKPLPSDFTDDYAGSNAWYRARVTWFKTNPAYRTRRNATIIDFGPYCRGEEMQVNDVFGKKTKLYFPKVVGTSFAVVWGEESFPRSHNYPVEKGRGFVVYIRGDESIEVIASWRGSSLLKIPKGAGREETQKTLREMLQQAISHPTKTSRTQGTEFSSQHGKVILQDT